MNIVQVESGWWRANCGFTLSDGKRKPKVFTLSKDKRVALKLAEAIESLYKLETATDPTSKLKVWSAASLNQFENIKAAITKQEPKQPNPTDNPPPTFSAPKLVVSNTFTPVVPYATPFPRLNLSLYEALDRWVQHERDRSGKEIGKRGGDDAEGKIASIKLHLADCDLHSIDAAWIETAARKLKERPKAQNKDTPISIATLQNWLMALGSAFQWFASRKSKIGWIPDDPIEWRYPLQLGKAELRNLRTLKERSEANKPKPIPNIEQLTLFYKFALPYERMMILLGLLGWTQIDISEFLLSEYVQDEKGERFIIKDRSKTEHPGAWWVCPELAALLDYFTGETAPNAEGRALLAQDNKPLRTHTLVNAWDRLLRRLPKGTTKFSYSKIRKLGGQLVENVSGSEELAQVLMAQKRQTIARKHYIGLDVDLGVGRTKYQQLYEVQKQIHKLLKPMFDAASQKQQRGAA